MQATILHGSQLIGIVLMTMISGVTLTHLLQSRPKGKLTSTQYLIVQQKLYVTYGAVVGLMELLASLAALTTVFLLPKDTYDFWLALVAYIGTVVTTLIWAIFIRPINNEVSKWTDTSIPKDWEIYRDRWSKLHTMRLFIILTAALIFVYSSHAPGR